MNLSKVTVLLFFLLTCCIAEISAQQGLTYSQTITLTGTANCDNMSYTDCATIATVPIGMTWKVEAISLQMTGGGMLLLINDNWAGQWGGTYLFTQPQFPFWLKPGDTMKLFVDEPTKYFISILEFQTN